MTTTDAKAHLNVNSQSPMRGWPKKKRAAEDTSLEGAPSKKAAAPASTPGHAHAEGREPDDAPPTTIELQEAPPQGVPWSYHSSQIDESNKFQRMSSAVVRGNFQELLLGDRGVYWDQFAIVSRMNPAIAGAIRDHTASQANMPRYERARSLFGYNDDAGASDTEEEAAVAGAKGFARFGREPRCDVRWAQNHSRSCEFIMPMMQRWCNMHSHCFILYSFSCIL